MPPSFAIGTLAALLALTGCASGPSPGIGQVQNAYRIEGAKGLAYNSYDAKRAYLRHANAVLAQATASDYDRPVQLIDAVQPAMSGDEIDEKLRGDVRLDIEFDEAGLVAATKVLSSPHPRLTQLAQDAVKRWRIEPATRGGKPARVELRQTFGFHTP